MRLFTAISLRLMPIAEREKLPVCRPSRSPHSLRPGCGGSAAQAPILMADPGCEICDTGYWRPEKAATIGLLPYSVELSSGGEAY